MADASEGPGSAAARPWHIPVRGWWDILVRVKDNVTDDALGMVAAAVAFYAFLSLFPGLAALVSVFGLVADPTWIQQQLAAVSGIVPPGARDLLMSQLQSLVSSGGGALSVGLVISILLALWSGSTAMGALITSLNIVYDEKETRGYVKPYLLRLLLTLAAMVFAVFTLFLIVAVPAALHYLDLPGFLQLVTHIARWILMAAAVVMGLAVIYSYAPSRRRPQWQWVSPGAVIGALLWLVGSALFSIYVDNFGSYNRMYGSFAAVIILMLWFNLSAYAVLLGAEVNAEMERQTKKDTTVGGQREAGRRDAYVADHVGRGNDS